MKHITFNKTCRICKGTKFTKVFSFGPQPPANAFLKKEKLQKHEQFYPLDVYLCHNCNLLQLRDAVAPEILFKDYVYVSSTSPVFRKHFENVARQLIKRFNMKPSSLVIDIGSNDGILLRPFKNKGIRVLGIEPAKNIAKIANAEHIETISQFFSIPLAKQIAQQHGPTDLVTATNVFAHINDLDEVLTGVKILIENTGVFMIEAPYLVDFLDNNLFDTVYHEHLSYLAVKPLSVFFNRFHMHIIDVVHTDVHGGSIAVFAADMNSKYHINASVQKFLNLEKRKNLALLSTYRQFAKRVEINKKNLIRLLQKYKKRGEKIAGYGAPAKGNTLLNYFGIDTALIDYIVDDSPQKQGLYTPGTHIPVVAPHILTANPPDFLLILAWNFAQSIMERLKNYKKSGGRFIIPIPKPEIY